MNKQEEEIDFGFEHKEPKVKMFDFDRAVDIVEMEKDERK